MRSRRTKSRSFSSNEASVALALSSDALSSNALSSNEVSVALTLSSNEVSVALHLVFGVSVAVAAAAVSESSV